MKTQKQQLLDYLAVHASEAELLGLCREIKDNGIAVGYFLKDVAKDELTVVRVDLEKSLSIDAANDDKVFGVLGRYLTSTCRISVAAGLSLYDTRRSLERLHGKGKVYTSITESDLWCRY